MSVPIAFPAARDAFAGLVREVKTRCDLDARLPDWPFLAPTAGFAAIYEYDRVLGGDFGVVLEALAREYGDDVVTVLGIFPPPSYYQKEYDYSPGFQVGRDDLPDSHGDRQWHEPNGDPTGALSFTIDVFAITGDSEAWSVWAQRDWEIGLLLTPRSAGPWQEVSIPSYGRDLDLDTIRSPAGWGMPLTRKDRKAFWENIRERGSGV